MIDEVPDKVVKAVYMMFNIYGKSLDHIANSL